MKTAEQRSLNKSFRQHITAEGLETYVWTQQHALTLLWWHKESKLLACVLFPGRDFEILQELWNSSSCWMWGMPGFVLRVCSEPLCSAVSLGIGPTQHSSCAQDIVAYHRWKCGFLFCSEGGPSAPKSRHPRMFLLNVKGLFKSIMVHIFILLGCPHCYPWHFTACKTCFSLRGNFLQVNCFFFNLWLTPS